jgi:hypothetical protein
MTDGSRDYVSWQRGRQLADLRWHWEEAYEITWDGRFRATRRDDGGKLEAETAEDLRQQMIRDYSERRVPRPRM